uniref:Uncharacterized protein n=1 Tax=Anguilla anguilla TaxID=7936 RepID=A0A0E9PTP7_ANGAN
MVIHVQNQVLTHHCQANKGNIRFRHNCECAKGLDLRNTANRYF